VLKSDLKKEDLIKNLSAETGFSYNFSKQLIGSLIEILIQNIKTGDFTLKNIGLFKILQKKERVGRDPKSKKQYIITSRKAVSFKPSKKINEYMKTFNE